MVAMASVISNRKLACVEKHACASTQAALDPIRRLHIGGCTAEVGQGPGLALEDAAGVEGEGSRRRKGGLDSHAVVHPAAAARLLLDLRTMQWRVRFVLKAQPAAGHEAAV